MRLRAINSTNCIVYSLEPRAHVYCLTLNFKILKLGYCSGDYRDIMCTLWLVKDCIISCYNYPTLGHIDCSTEALVFKMAQCDFLMFLKEQWKWKKMHLLSCVPTRKAIITWAIIIILNKIVFSGSVNIVSNNALYFILGIIQQYSLRLRRIILLLNKWINLVHYSDYLS